jgi:hypothetical protein
MEREPGLPVFRSQPVIDGVNPMMLEQRIITHLHQLPPERQAEVLDFIEFLLQRQAQAVPAAGAEARPPECHRDLDDLFGAWSSEEYDRIQAATQEQRRIDPEVWQ